MDFVIFALVVRRYLRDLREKPKNDALAVVAS
jgi:hypothetical protein